MMCVDGTGFEGDRRGQRQGIVGECVLDGEIL